MNRKLYRFEFIFFLILISGLINGCMSQSMDTGCNEYGVNCTGNIYTYELDNGMVIDIYLPLEYNPNSRYPVLILNDGEVIFSETYWNMGNRLNRLIEQEFIEPIIAIAVYNSGRRMDWYIPYRDQWIIDNMGAYESKAEWYADQILNNLLPAVNEMHPIDMTRVGIVGASFGGLISTWMGLKYPDQITYSASLSGSFWVDDYRIFEEVAGSYKPENLFWFDIGTSEWNYYVPLYYNLDQAGITPGEQSFYLEVPGGRHTESDWLKRIHYPLILFFGTTEPEPVEMNIVLECIPSQSTPGLKFRRMNPIVTLSNNVQFSLAHAAEYTIISGEAELGTEGSFRNNSDTEAHIQIDYLNFTEIVTIPRMYCS